MFSAHLFILAIISALVPSTLAGHVFTMVNSCSYAVHPVIANTNCGYSSRCSGAISYTGSQPGTLAPGATKAVTINSAWVGRIFNQNGSCGGKGEQCTILEYNLDSGSFYTPQAYDISNIQGFTQSISTGASGCESVTCTSASCPCNQAYRPDDMSGCGADYPVRACGSGDIAFTVTFCP